MRTKLNLASLNDSKAANRILSAILIILVLGIIASLSYVIANPGGEEKFTEFYVLGPEGMATGYPQAMQVGEEGRVIIGIINREQEMTSYRLEVKIDGVTHSQEGPIILENDEKWEKTVSFTPQRAGEQQRVEFLLYRDGESEPYLKPLQLLVNVIE